MDLEELRSHCSGVDIIIMNKGEDRVEYSIESYIR